MNVHHDEARTVVVTPMASPSSSIMGEEPAVRSVYTNDEEDLLEDPMDQGSTNEESPFSLSTQVPPVMSLAMDDDKLRAMLSLEASSYQAPTDYLMKSGSRSERHGHATENWRRRLCEWMFEVADHFNFDREVVSISSYYMDRIASMAYDQKQSYATKREFQLDAVGSLYLALKVHGEMDPDSGEERLKLRLSNFVELSRGFFPEEVIVAKEKEILNALDWHINPPTSAQFLYHYLQFLPDWTVDEDDNEELTSRHAIWIKIFDMAKYLTELSVFISKFSFGVSPSIVAYAALLCGLDYVQDETPFPVEAQAQLLSNLHQVNSSLLPSTEEMIKLVCRLKKLAPDFFPRPVSNSISRTVSILDVESANSVAATSSSEQNNKKRAISPTCVSQVQQQQQQQSSRKKARRTLRRDNQCHARSSV